MNKSYCELLDELVAEKAGFKSPPWYSFNYEKAIQGGIFAIGAVCPLNKTGKNKGRPNYRNRDRDTQRKVYISREELSKIERASMGENENEEEREQNVK